MVVAAMLAWYDEPPELLDAAVRSAATVADMLVAADGRYQRVPGPALSPDDQADTIRHAAQQAGLRLWLVRIPEPWPGQVAKRNAMLKLACAKADWVMPLDADWVLHGDRHLARAALADTADDTLEVAFHTPRNPSRAAPPATGWHAETEGGTAHYPLLMRTLPGLRLHKFHWIYLAEKNGSTVVVWGDHDGLPKASRDRIPHEHLWIEHRSAFRDKLRVERTRDFCADREHLVAATGQEDPV
jgi:hypothetical protein